MPPRRPPPPAPPPTTLDPADGLASHVLSWDWAALVKAATAAGRAGAVPPPLLGRPVPRPQATYASAQVRVYVCG